MTLTGHRLNTLIQTCITKRQSAITIIQQSIDGLSLCQSCQCTVLPMNRTCIRQRTLQTLMSQTKSTMTQFQSSLENIPELIKVVISRQTNVGKVDRYDALIETTIIFRFICLRIDIRSQEGSASPLYSYDSQHRTVCYKTSLCYHRILDYITHRMLLPHQAPRHFDLSGLTYTLPHHH